MRPNGPAFLPDEMIHQSDRSDKNCYPQAQYTVFLHYVQFLVSAGCVSARTKHMCDIMEGYWSLLSVLLEADGDPCRI